MGFFRARRPEWTTGQERRSLAMTSNPSQVIVVPEEHKHASTHGLCAHHRDFPEVHGEGSSPRDAAVRLAELLSSILENAPSDYRRQIIQQAIEDVRAFAERDRS